MSTMTRTKKLGLRTAVVAGGIAFAGLAGAGLGSGTAMADTPVDQAQSAYSAAPNEVQGLIDQGVNALRGAGVEVPQFNTPAPAPEAPNNVLPMDAIPAVASSRTGESSEDITNTSQNENVALAAANNQQNQGAQSNGDGDTQETGKARQVSLREISPDLANLATSRSLPELVGKYVPGGEDWMIKSGTMNAINGALDGAIANGKTTQVDELPENNVVGEDTRRAVRDAAAPYLCGKDVCADAVADFVVNSLNGGIDDMIQLGTNPGAWMNRHMQLTQVGIGGAAAGVKSFTDDPAMWTAERFNELANPDAAFYDWVRGVGGEELAYAAYVFASKNLPRLQSYDGKELNWPKLVLLGAALTPAAIGLALGTVVALPIALAVAAIGTLAWIGFASTITGGTMGIIGIPLFILTPVVANIIFFGTLIPLAVIIASPFIITSAIFTGILLAVTHNVPWEIDGTGVRVLPPSGDCPEDGAPTLINPNGNVSPLDPEERIGPKVNTWVNELRDIPGFFLRALTDPNAPASPL